MNAYWQVTVTAGHTVSRHEFATPELAWWFARSQERRGYTVQVAPLRGAEHHKEAA